VEARFEEGGDEAVAVVAVGVRRVVLGPGSSTVDEEVDLLDLDLRDAGVRDSRDA
jgi:hypothetical protein